MLFPTVNSGADGTLYSDANNGRMTSKRTNIRMPQSVDSANVNKATAQNEAQALKSAFEAHARSAGLSQERFGLEFDIGSQGMVWQYLNGHRPLNLSVALKFARGLNVPVETFSPRLAHELRAAGVMESTGLYTATESINILRASRIPVVATAQGEGQYLEITYSPGDGFVSYPSKRANAYAIRMKGDINRPRIKPGEYVIIEPDVPCVPGDEVLVRTKSGHSMVKVLHATRSGFVELLSLNDDQKPLTLDLAEIESMHHVAGIAKEILYRPEQGAAEGTD